MSQTTEKRRIWIWIPIASAVLLIVAGIHFLQSDGSQMRQVVSRLAPGMTRLELEEVLRPVHEDRPVTAKSGQVEFLFYAVDEFVKVTLDKPDAAGRVINIEHIPDSDFTWDHCRRRLESCWRRLHRIGR
jgi:hypothetical protein